MTIKLRKYLVDIQTQTYNRITCFPELRDHELILAISESTQFIGSIEKRINDHYKYKNQKVTIQDVLNIHVEFDFDDNPISLVVHVIYNNPIHVLVGLDPERLKSIIGPILEKICVYELKINVDALFYYYLTIE